MEQLQQMMMQNKQRQRTEEEKHLLDKNTMDADKFLGANEFEKAVASAGKALEEDNMRLKPYIQRAIGFQRLGKPEEALAAAESGICVADKLKDKEQLGEAHVRRAIALFNLGRYADAQASLNWAVEEESKNKSIDIWKLKIEQNLKTAESSEVTIERVPSHAMPKPQIGKKKKPVSATPSSKIEVLDDNEEDEDLKAAIKEKNEYEKNMAPQVKKVVDFDPNNVRFDFFQSSSAVDASLFLKNVPKDTVNVEFSATEARLTCKQPSSGSDFVYTLGPFPHPVKPEESSFRVFATKVELNLKKADSSKWDNLVSKETAREKKEEVSLDDMRKALNEPKLPSVNGDKNWDKLADAELEKDPEGDSSNPNAFFEQLYANADEDTRRAMMKSFVESNGTSLSTDWSEVSKGKVETVPPEGMEAKNWKK